MYKRVPGTKDILPDEVSRWQKIEEVSRKIFSIHNYLEIRPPLIEEAALFNRSLGESTEIVQKQMFLINREKDIYALRPEATASVVRAYIENNLDKTSGFVKLYYLGPMFRAERPQKGRLRQFHQIGVEAIGSRNERLDIEVIWLADKLLRAYSIAGYKTVINSLGCAKDKKELIRLLREKLKDKISHLCPNCQDRYDNNVLRITDCKNESCQKIIDGLGLKNNYLCPECEQRFRKVQNGLKDLQVDFEVSPRLVRGLDYYTGTVFEFKHPDLGPQQDALGAGGRYDNLVKELGGPDVGAIGFAFGVERLLLVTSQESVVRSKNLVYIISLGEEAELPGIKLLSELRKAQIHADTDFENKSLKAAMRRANDLGARFVLILGEDELKEQAVTFKDMDNSTQEKIKIDELIPHIRKRLAMVDSQ